MTVCIPKRPFIILGKIILYTALFSWIPISIGIFYYADRQQNWNLLFMIIPFCVCQIIFTIIWLDDINRKNHYVKWCDEQQNQTKVSNK